jgi:G3E family GTPase
MPQPATGLPIWPISIVTGFLGSGKTTLISRVLADPMFARTAVIVNEFGEIGLDHELVVASTESFLQLASGCLCCRVRGDLAGTLLDLASQRSAGTVPPFDRVLIETSGLADPAPILHALMMDAGLARQFAVDSVLTLVDAVNGAAALERHPEAWRQVALADRLLLTKLDLAGNAGALRATLAGLNPSAPVLEAVSGAISPELLFPAGDPDRRMDRLQSLPGLAGASPFAARHTAGIDTFTLLRERPVPALALTLLLAALTEHCGARLLRVKGLVEVAEMPETPAVIHGVGHVFAPPVWLDRWPSADRTTRLVFITEGVPRYFPSRLLAAIEAEVIEETGRTPWN